MAERTRFSIRLVNGFSGESTFNTAGPNDPDDNRFDAWGVGFAVGMNIYNGAFHNLGTDIMEFGVTEIDDDPNDRIYNIVPLDHDGNGLTDLWLCQGPGYKSGTWVLARNNGDSQPGLPYGFDYYDTHIGCSTHDELHVVGLHTPGRQNLLTIPAYDTIADPFAYSPPSAYVDNVPPIPDSDKTEYFEVRFEGGALGELVPTGLPRDLFARWHDRRCHNGIADAQMGIPVFGAGLSNDKRIDVNRDGLVDILRFELATGDTHVNISAIKSGIDNQEWTYAHAGCDYENDDDHEDAIVALFVNTGAGFVRHSDPVHEFSGIPHANFWINFVNSQVVDENGDGRLDLLLPSTGYDGKWASLRSTGWGSFQAHTPDPGDNEDVVPNGSVWPSYRSDASWKDEAGFLASTGVRATEFGARGVTFYGDINGGTTAHTMYGFSQSTAADRVVVTAVTDGMGRRDTFKYAMERPISGHIAASHRPAEPSRQAFLTVARLDQQVGPESYTSTLFEYAGPVVDRHGRGFIGFQTTTQTTIDPKNDREINRTTAEYDLGRDSTIADYPEAGAPTRSTTLTHFTDAYDRARLQVTCSETEDWKVVEPHDGVWFSYPALRRSYAGDVPAGAETLSDETANCDDLDSVRDTDVEVRTVLDDFGSPVFSETRVEGGSTTTIVGDALPIINDVDNWFISRPQRVETTSCVPTSAGDECETRTNEYVYNNSKHTLVQSIREPDDPELYLSTSFSYDDDGFGNLETVTVSDHSASDPRTTVTTWDDEGTFALDQTIEVGGVEHTTWLSHHRPSGVVLAAAGSSGVTTKTSYDGFFRPVRNTRHVSPTAASDSSTTHTEYLLGDPATGVAMEVVESRSGDDQVSRLQLGPAGREIKRFWKGVRGEDTFPIPHKEVGEDLYVATEYDSLGRVARVSHPTWSIDPEPYHWTSYTYDDLGRVTSRTVADATGFFDVESESWAFLHHSSLNWSSYTDFTATTIYTDPSKRESSVVTDVDGRSTVSLNADGVATCLEYGAFNRLSLVERNCGTDPSGPTAHTVFTHDRLGRVTSELDSTTGFRATEYTAYGGVDYTIDGNLELVRYTYDELGRLLTRVDSDGTSEWKWDTNFIGALDSSESPDGVRRSFTYDDNGRLQSQSTVIPIGQSSVESKILYEYNYKDDLRIVTYDSLDGLRLIHRYDPGGYLRSIHEGTLSDDLIWAWRGANEQTQIVDEVYGNGAVTTRAYDHAHARVESISTVSAPEAVSGTTVLRQKLSYGWLAGGDLDWRQDTVNGQNETFSYDDLGRLDTSSVGGEVVMDVDYDELGNITSKSDVGTYVYDEQGRLFRTISSSGSTTYTYDGNSAVREKGQTDLTWTPFEKVRALTSADADLSFAYDADGQRVSRHDVTNDTYIVTPGAGLELYYTAAGDLELAKIRIGGADGRTVAQMEVKPPKNPLEEYTTELRYVHDDHLGSGAVVTAADADASVEHETAYDAWGRARRVDKWSTYASSSSQDDLPTGFTGHQARLDADLINMRGRMYEPRTGAVHEPGSTRCRGVGYPGVELLCLRQEHAADPYGSERLRAEGRK